MPESVQDRGPTPAPVLRLGGISKTYGGVVALQDVDFGARTHSIHAVLGENGAGKSTLIKVIAGVVVPDTGTVEIEGRTLRFSGPGDAVAAGVVCVFQELSLVPDLTVAENICIAPAPGRFGLIDKRAQRRRAEQLLARVGCADVNPRLPVRELPLSRRQLVELAKALGRRPRILILDEATSALTARDVETVNRILNQLRDQGLTILLISHRMHEIEALADTCSVFRGGRHIETYAEGSRTAGEVLQLMIGREISQVYPAKPSPPDQPDPALRVEHLSWGDRLHDLSFTVGRGEVVGLGGLDGQGQRSVLLGLFGVLRDLKGTIAVAGKPTAIHSPADAKSAGLDIAMVPEDRKSEGLMLSMSVRENMTLAALDRLSRGPFVDLKRERLAVDAEVESLGIKSGSLEHPVGTLSGGNQQKVVLAKWLMNQPRIIMLMDPTRGVDVGTKQEFYRIIRELAAQGVAILFYSTDYDEIIGMCDRVLILYGGRIVRELAGSAITENNIVGASFNLAPDTAARAV